MTHFSPAVYVFWSCLSTSLLAFLIYHLYKFDRFKSLRWGQEGSQGAFKRIMTFAYLISVPLIVSYSIGMAVIKYREGYSAVVFFGIIPTPYQLWTPQDLSLILPLEMIFSVAWSLEIVSHLEELCFWLFLTSVGTSRSHWFQSVYFKIWAAGSIISVVGLPVVTWLKRADPTVCEAWTFLVGGSGSLLITILSLRVAQAIPRLVNQVKSAGGEPEVVVRLSTFHDLNVKRLVFRFLFVIPVFILAVDGVTPHQHINENYLWTDFLASLIGIGLVASSMLTLLIFFPRSIEREAGYKPRMRSRSRSNTADVYTGAPPTPHTGTALAANSPYGSTAQLTRGGAPMGGRGADTDSRGYGTKSDVGLISEIHVKTTHTTSFVELEDPDLKSSFPLGRSKSSKAKPQVWEMVTIPEGYTEQLNSPGGGSSTSPSPIDARRGPPQSDREVVAPFEFQKQVSKPSTYVVGGPAAAGGNEQATRGRAAAGAVRHAGAPQRPPRKDIHPMLMNYTSPINLHDDPFAKGGGSYGYV